MGIGLLPILLLFWNCILWQSLLRGGPGPGPFVSAQVRPTDLSINCGSAPGSTPYTNPDTTYVFTNDNFITTGEIANTTANDSVTDDLRTLRYFPASSTPVKNCYEIPVQNETQYLLRAWFYFGNYIPAPLSGTIKFQLALDATVWRNVSIDTTSSDSVIWEEAMVWTAKPSISFCLIRTADTDAPFVNSLELREIKILSYIENINASYPSSIFLNMVHRTNFGFQNETFRYPQDTFDRIWPPMDNYGLEWTPIFAPNYPNQVMNFNATSQTSSDFPPSVVMQSAITSPGWLLYSLEMTNPIPASRFYSRLYFAELETLPAGSSRVMDLLTNFMPLTLGIEIYNLTAYGLYTVLQAGTDDFEKPASDSLILLFNLSRDPSSSYDPMINAVEFCIIHDVLPGTDAEDVTALTALKTSLGYTQWVGDPCDPVPWDELGCTQDRVTSLNLSSKNLTGSIPSDISNLTALTSLNLSENQLVGPIPIWVGDLFLQTLDVSNNNLSGSFPATYFLTISNFRYSGNPLLICVDVPTSSAACPQSPAPAPVPSPPPPSKTSGKTSTGPIIGGVAGAIVVLLVAGGLLIWYMCAAPDKSVSIRTPPSPSMGVGPIRTTAAHHVPRNKTRPFTLQAIKVATTNFSTKIGEGGFGPVYHGIVDGQQEVAVKVMSQTTRQGFDEFLNEIDLLSSIHHKSLVNLLGYCEEELELILLYEYMPGGDLRNRLQGPMALQHPLNWSQRLQIALDAAKGLQYLHHGCNPSIIHRDVKSSNILLNQNLEAKVADFGLSKLTDGQSNLVTAVKGTFGYLDPEYNRTGLLNDKTDVYSFGIVLMEILCGHPPFVRQGQFIVDKVKSAMNSGAVLSVVDPVLREADIPVESVWRYVDIAMACVSPSSTSRPSMQTVVSELRSLALESQRQTAGGTDFSGDYPDPTPDQPSLIFYASEDPSAQ